MKGIWTRIMRKSILCAAYALLAATSTLYPAHAETNIDVLLVFSDDVALSTFEKTVVAARYQNVLGAVYGIPGVPFFGQLDGGLRTVEVWPLLTSVSYVATGKSNADALQWMVDENAKLLPIPSLLRASRELFGNPGADVIIMVVPSTTDNDCGGAQFVPKLAGTFRSETNAFAITYLQDVNPTCIEEVVVPHELGHVLYAEHETDTNNDLVSPSPDNHATTDTFSGTKSLMWDGLNAFSSTFLSGYFSTNTVPGWADNVEYFSDDSFDIVSTYRSVPVTQAFNCPTEYTGCWSNTEQWLVSWGSAFSMSHVFLERSNNGGTTWWPETVGGVVCVPQLVSNTSLFRFSGITIWGAATDYCNITVYGGTDCDDYQAW